MTKPIITNYLNKFDYKYIENEKSLIVELDFSLQMIIDLSDQDKIKINDQLKSWIQGKIKRNGKTVEKAIQNLIKMGLVRRVKNHTICANPVQRKEIYDYIDKNLK